MTSQIIMCGGEDYYREHCGECSIESGRFPCTDCELGIKCNTCGGKRALWWDCECSDLSQFEDADASVLSPVMEDSAHKTASFVARFGFDEEAEESASFVARFGFDEKADVREWGSCEWSETNTAETSETSYITSVSTDELQEKEASNCQWIECYKCDGTGIHAKSTCRYCSGDREYTNHYGKTYRCGFDAYGKRTTKTNSDGSIFYMGCGGTGIHVKPCHFCDSQGGWYKE